MSFIYVRHHGKIYKKQRKDRSWINSISSKDGVMANEVLRAQPGHWQNDLK